MMREALCGIEEVPYCISRSSIEFQGHTGQENHRFWLELSISGLQLQLEFTHDFETMLDVVSKRCPVVFQGYPSNFKVTRDKKLPILTWIERLWTVTPVWIHQWIWNDAQSLTYYRKGALFFVRSSIKFQGHTGWKIDDLNPIWIRLLGQSQLSNPSDLPCFIMFLSVDAFNHCVWGGGGPLIYLWPSPGMPEWSHLLGLCAACWAHFMCRHKLWYSQEGHRGEQCFWDESTDGGQGWVACRNHKFPSCCRLTASHLHHTFRLVWYCSVWLYFNQGIS